jgi:hypothetical protein
LAFPDASAPVLLLGLAALTLVSAAWQACSARAKRGNLVASDLSTSLLEIRSC